MTESKIPKESDASHHEKSVSKQDTKNLNTQDDQPALDEQWLSIAEDWQSQPYEKVDVKALLKQTQRRTLWAKFLLFLDVISTAFICVVFIYAVYKGEWKTATLIYIGSASIAGVFYTAYAIKVRMRSWRLMAGDPNKIVESALIGCKSSLQYIKLVKWSGAPLFVWVNTYLYFGSIDSEKPIMPAVILANGIIIVITLVSYYFQRQRERELQQLESFLSE